MNDYVIMEFLLRQAVINNDALFENTKTEVTMDSINQFLKDHFNNLTLRPPLFYLCDYGIRFEIAIPWVEHENKNNLNQIKDRTITIFNKVFNEEDEIILVTDIHCEKYNTILQKRPTKVYQKYIKDKGNITRLQHKVLPNVFMEDEDGEDYADMVTHRFSLPCKKSDIRFQQLLTAISYEDFHHPTRILKGHAGHGMDIYFINVTRKMIYHLYDDRGCDVVAAHKEDLYTLYHECNDWILDYDREKIDKLLKNKE